MYLCGLLGEKNCSLIFTISKWISLLLQIFSLVLFGGTRLATLAVSWHPLASHAVNQWVSRSGVRRGSVHWVPLCCGPLGVRRQPHSAALPPGPGTEPHSTRLQSGKETALLRPASRGSPATHGISDKGPPPLHPAVVLPSPISQFFDTKITLAGRCNSHISGIFASVTFFFF